MLLLDEDVVVEVLLCVDVLVLLVELLIVVLDVVLPVELVDVVLPVVLLHVVLVPVVVVDVLIVVTLELLVVELLVDVLVLVVVTVDFVVLVLVEVSVLLELVVLVDVEVVDVKNCVHVVTYTSLPPETDLSNVRAQRSHVRPRPPFSGSAEQLEQMRIFVTSPPSWHSCDANCPPLSSHVVHQVHTV